VDPSRTEARRTPAIGSPLCSFSATCDLEASQGGARRSLLSVLSSLHECVERTSNSRQEEEEKEEGEEEKEKEEEDDCGVGGGDENVDVAFKEWISWLCFLSPICHPHRVWLLFRVAPHVVVT